VFTKDEARGYFVVTFQWCCVVALHFPASATRVSAVGLFHNTRVCHWALCMGKIRPNSGC